MNIQNKVNILVLMDAHSCRQVFRIQRYILFHDQHFILITNENHCELLRMEDVNGITQLFSASSEEIYDILLDYKLPNLVIQKGMTYRAVGLMFTEDIKVDESRAYKFKLSGEEESIDLMPYLQHLNEQ
ncbi:hypothetical protein [Paenibacillus sp. B01]|uniref:hypothetical protein n=1 Tax=Paenibacillus sp. B01 TaxID=2660554 RepID=UPI00129A4D05|nr:hypothetical protein [Paenibacillus sp. B01]QGG55061.1 hypothetical protein GE073_05330 [Paenibacillus sp. B01]